jgi:hypothetical protein
MSKSLIIVNRSMFFGCTHPKIHFSMHALKIA